MAQRIITEEIQTLLLKKSGVAIKSREMIHIRETPHHPIAMHLLSLTVVVLLRWFKVPAWPIRFFTRTPSTWHRAFLVPRRHPPTNPIQEVTQVAGVDCKVHNNQHRKEIQTSALPLLRAAPVILHQEIAGEGGKRRRLLMYSRRILNFACSLT